MKPKTRDAWEIVEKALDTVTCDGPSRRMIQSAVEHLKSETQKKKAPAKK